MKRLLNTLLWFIQSNGQYPNWNRKEAFIRCFLWVTGLYGKVVWIVEFRLIFLTSFVRQICNILIEVKRSLTLWIFPELEFSVTQTAKKKFFVTSTLGRKRGFSSFSSKMFSRNLLKAAALWNVSNNSNVYSRKR